MPGFRYLMHGDVIRTRLVCDLLSCASCCEVKCCCMVLQPYLTAAATAGAGYLTAGGGGPRYVLPGGSAALSGVRLSRRVDVSF